MSLAGDQLTVEGAARAEDRDGSTERRLAFQVTVPTAVTTEGASATVRHGVLTIELPKRAEARRRGRRIDVAAA